MAVAIFVGLFFEFFMLVLRIITNAVLLDTIFSFLIVFEITNRMELNSLVCFLISLAAALIVISVLKFVKYIRAAALIGFGGLWGYLAYLIACGFELPFEWSIFIGIVVFLYHVLIGMASAAEESVDPVGGLFSGIKGFFRRNEFTEQEFLQNDDNSSDTQIEGEFTDCSNKIDSNGIRELLLDRLKDNQELRVTYDKDGNAEFAIISKQAEIEE
ncbi:MAG: hypothetical protein LUC92_03425 [Clostridiales bacterium]|nr:hypothetical protein [Clostridiales bacterium]